MPKYFFVRFLVGLVAITLALCIVFGFIAFKKPVVANQSDGSLSSSAVVAPKEIIPIVLPPIPQVVFISPSDGAQDVLLDIEDPLMVRFNASAQDFFVDFRLEPNVSVMYENNPEKTEFKLLPKEPLALMTPYTLQVFIKRRGMDDTAYKIIASSRFTTIKEVLNEQQRTVARTLSDAKRSTVAKIDQGRYIDIDLAHQMMVLFDNGKPIDAYLVSSGKRGMETPKGQFAIENKVSRAWSKTYGLFMPNWMAITPSGKFGIHELPEWPSGYKEGANHLGRPVSHGCVRLGVGAAKRVFDFADIGTPVIVH